MICIAQDGTACQQQLTPSSPIRPCCSAMKCTAVQELTAAQTLTWVCEDVGVAQPHPLAGEGPVLLGAASVVVVDERHRTRRPPPDQAWSLALNT